VTIYLLGKACVSERKQTSAFSLLFLFFVLGEREKDDSSLWASRVEVHFLTRGVQVLRDVPFAIAHDPLRETRIHQIRLRGGVKNTEFRMRIG